MVISIPHITPIAPHVSMPVHESIPVHETILVHENAPVIITHPVTSWLPLMYHPHVQTQTQVAQQNDAQKPDLVLELFGVLILVAILACIIFLFIERDS